MSPLISRMLPSPGDQGSFHVADSGARCRVGVRECDSHTKGRDSSRAAASVRGRSGGWMLRPSSRRNPGVLLMRASGAQAGEGGGVALWALLVCGMLIDDVRRAGTVTAGQGCLLRVPPRSGTLSCRKTIEIEVSQRTVAEPTTRSPLASSCKLCPHSPAASLGWSFLGAMRGIVIRGGDCH